MQTLRRLLSQHYAIALIMAFAALCIKALVPAGYMVRSDSAAFSVQICGEPGAADAARQMVVTMKQGGSDSDGRQDKGDCPFAAGPTASIPATDGQLLLAALLFILALGFAAVTPARPARLHFLRPPLRGPPTLT